MIAILFAAMYLSLAILFSIGCVVTVIDAFRGVRYSHILFIPMFVIAVITYAQAFAWMSLLLP